MKLNFSTKNNSSARELSPKKLKPIKMLLVKAEQIITQNKKRQIIKNGAIVIEKDLIKDIGPAEEISKKYKNKIKKTIKMDRGAAMPGLINTHTHLAMSLLRGYSDDLPLEKWWFEKIYPIESKFTKEDIYIGSLLGGMEMIKSGTTTFVDFYYFIDETAKATEQLGLRANLGIAVLDVETFAFKNAGQILAEAEIIIKKYQKNPLIQISLAPHMFQTLSLDSYIKCQQLARKYGILLQTHLAETEAEINFCLEKYGKRPAQLLAENKILDKKSLVAHCCHLNNEDIQALSSNSVNISHCPISNQKLSSGAMPLSKLLEAGINISLGTDGASSNNNLDMFEEMKFAALKHKLTEKNPIVADAQTILDMATINGAEAIGKEKELGSLEIGKKADIIILDFNQPHLAPLHNVISSLVYSANGADVKTVIINGKVIMENRKILLINEQKILEKIKRKYEKF